MTRIRASVVGVLAAALVAVVLPGCGGGGYTLTATFADAGDLQQRASVQIADVKVGTISGVTLTEDYRAKVEMSVNDGVQVPKQSEAVLRTTSLLGEKFIELRPTGPPEAAARGPFFADGDDLGTGVEAPELEFIADQAVIALGSVVAKDISTLVNASAVAFGGRGDELKSIITDLGTISSTLAGRTNEIGRIIDGIDKATQVLADNRDDFVTLLDNLAQTTQILVDNRQLALDALSRLNEYSVTQSDLIRRYRADIDKQLRQVDAILDVVVQSQAEVVNLVDWLEKFVEGIQKVVPGDFTQVYAWLQPALFDCRSPGNVVGPCPPGMVPPPK